ncbi:MAG: hypothetical protein R3E79_27910 [Caldilineaceae bacterium]
MTQIAPTVAQPEAYVDYGIPWQELTVTVGKRWGKPPKRKRWSLPWKRNLPRCRLTILNSPARLLS